jgi:hypothetical protein
LLGGLIHILLALSFPGWNMAVAVDPTGGFLRDPFGRWGKERGEKIDKTGRKKARISDRIETAMGGRKNLADKKQRRKIL